MRLDIFEGEGLSEKMGDLLDDGGEWDEDKWKRDVGVEERNNL